MMIICVFSDDRDNLRSILDGFNFIMDYGWYGEYFIIADGFQEEYMLGHLAWIYELNIVELEESEVEFLLHEFEEIPDIDFLLECMNVAGNLHT